jgi:hypothetical protein
MRSRRPVGARQCAADVILLFRYRSWRWARRRAQGRAVAAAKRHAHATVIDNGAPTMLKALARAAPRAPHHFRPRFPTSPRAPRFSTSSHARMSAENKQPQVEYRRLGNSGLRVSVPILGAMSIGTDKWAPWVINEDEVRSEAWTCMRRVLTSFRRSRCSRPRGTVESQPGTRPTFTRTASRSASSARRSRRCVLTFYPRCAPSLPAPPPLISRRTLPRLRTRSTTSRATASSS